MRKPDSLNTKEMPKRKRGRPPKTQAEQAEIKKKIVSIASTVFQSEGYEAVSMRRLAKEIGLTPMSLYVYFPSKLAILSHLWIGIFKDVGQDMARALASEVTPEAQLRAMSSAYVQYWLDKREHYFLVFMSGGLTRGDVTEFVAEGSAVQKFAPFFQIIAQGMALEAQDVRVKARVDQLVCGLHGVMHCIITIPGYDWTDADTLVRSMVRNVMRG